MKTKMKTKMNFKVVILSLALIWSISAVQAQDKKETTLFNNVKVFNGIDEKLMDVDVLVEGHLIKQVAKGIKAPKGTKVIDGGGRTLMPGMADTHVHLAFATLPQQTLLFGEASYGYINSSVDAKTFLMNGVTTVRDMGGNTFGLKMAIDQGIVEGPRIYPSGGVITQTAGHVDFRTPNQKHPRFGGTEPAYESEGHAYIVDGVPLVLAAARENLRHGASQIKLAAGGGYASPADPLWGDQFTFEEIKAAADAAGDWGTYVTIHSYHPSAINKAIDAGVKDIGHGHLLDKATLQKMADKGVFLSTQPFTVCNEPQLDDFSNSKLNQVCKGTEFIYKTAKEIPNLKLTYGTDIFLSPKEELAKSVKMMERLLPWYTPGEILIMATGNAGELFKLSGLRNPYIEGDLGVVKEGAYADMLLVNGNPLDDIKMVTENSNIRIIMKDGKIFKNTMSN
jgi:imidazolonepropionase-like amidohydrolase